MSTPGITDQAPPNGIPTLSSLEEIVRATSAEVAANVSKQVAATGIATATKDLTDAHADLVGRVSSLEAAAVPDIGAIGASLVTRAETDPVLQRTLAIMLAGGALAIVFTILLADFLGSHAAADMVGGAWALFGGVIVAFVYRLLGAPGIPKSTPAVPVTQLAAAIRATPATSVTVNQAGA